MRARARTLMQTKTEEAELIYEDYEILMDQIDELKKSASTMQLYYMKTTVAIARSISQKRKEEPTGFHKSPPRPTEAQEPDYQTDQKVIKQYEHSQVVVDNSIKVVNARQNQIQNSQIQSQIQPQSQSQILQSQRPMNLSNTKLDGSVIQPQSQIQSNLASSSVPDKKIDMKTNPKYVVPVLQQQPNQYDEQISQLKNEIQKVRLLLKDEKKQREDLEQKFIEQMNTVNEQIDQLKKENEKLKMQSAQVGNRYLKQIKQMKKKREVLSEIELSNHSEQSEFSCSKEGKEQPLKVEAGGQNETEDVEICGAVNEIIENLNVFQISSKPASRMNSQRVTLIKEMTLNEKKPEEDEFAVKSVVQVQEDGQEK